MASADDGDAVGRLDALLDVHAVLEHELHRVGVLAVDPHLVVQMAAGNSHDVAGRSNEGDQVPGLDLLPGDDQEFRGVPVDRLDAAG